MSLLAEGMKLNKRRLSLKRFHERRKGEIEEEQVITRVWQHKYLINENVAGPPAKTEIVLKGAVEEIPAKTTKTALKCAEVTAGNLQ